MKLTLRAQIALATGLVVLIVVAIAGATIALRMDHRDRTTVDTQLLARAERVTTDLDKLLTDGAHQQPGDDSYGNLLDGSESLVRLIEGTTVVAQRGAIPDQPLPPPTADGLTTLTVDGMPWRSYTVSAGDSIRLQVLQSLEPVDDRRTANTQLVAVVTILAAAIAAAAGWLVGSTVLRPLHRLTQGADRISDDPDPHHRLPAVTRPPEVARLSTTLNSMLDRLDASNETTRQFTADVGHELRGPLAAANAYLETLLGSPDLPDEIRRAVAATYEQQQRMTATLGALQTLARTDAGALPNPADIDPGLLVDQLVRRARHLHPFTTFTLADTTDGVAITGWEDGLRIAINNLLDNAAIHGRQGGHVDVVVTATGHAVTISVSDDGPGIPSDQREYLRQRFTRGAHAPSSGTGLGLALVDQQTSLHGGTLALRNSPNGGLSAILTIPTRP